jgi:hypothetical protein
MRTQKPALGIMACGTSANGQSAFRQSETFRRLCQAGDALGITVFVFTPEALLVERDSAAMLTGSFYCSQTGDWRQEQHPLPGLVYDRTFYAGAKDLRYSGAARRKLNRLGIPLLQRMLPGKWEVQQVLTTSTELAPHLPPTDLYGRGVRRRLARQGAVFLKPDCGSQGKGCAVLTLHKHGSEQVREAREDSKESRGSTDSKDRAESAVSITPTVPLFTANGRDKRNQPFSLSFADSRETLAWLTDFTARTRYLVQDYLQLKARDGRVYDIRSLVQKDGAGVWTITGMAARHGSPGSATSNLHGGGLAEEAERCLAASFGPAEARRLLHSLAALSMHAAHTLEEHYGPLAELGLDFGIDHDGHIWLIEANSKPGRSVFRLIGDRKAEIRSTYYPVAYARRLLLHHTPKFRYPRII